jgi:hypothetical protein
MSDISEILTASIIITLMIEAVSTSLKYPSVLPDYLAQHPIRQPPSYFTEVLHVLALFLHYKLLCLIINECLLNKCRILWKKPAGF